MCANTVLIRQIFKLKKLINVKPIKCLIEDFILISYTDDGKIRYNIYPVVKNLDNNKLYFTFSNYSLTSYNTRYSQLNNAFINMNIYRKDKSTVKIGDLAYLYILKNLDFIPEINLEENIIKIDNKKIRFKHINEKYDISMFEYLNYFEGVIDIENNI